MKIICVGFWKTGTKSMAEALEYLGYKVYDYDYQYFELKDLWWKIVDGTVTDEYIRQAVKDVDAIIDGPCIAFWEEIARAVPDAKVILTTRDEDSWWRSYKGMINEMPFYFKWMTLLMHFTPTGSQFIRIAWRLATLAFGVEGPFSMPFFCLDDNPRMYKYQFRKHNSHVMHSVPKNNLLVFNVGDGWEPLCRFLEKDVPDIPYPRKNVKGAHFKTEGGPKHPDYKRIMIEVVVVVTVLVVLFAMLVCYIAF